MRLKLVLKGPARLMGARTEKTLENGSLVVGRSPAAGWVLPDPEKVISKAHCRIDADFSGFVLTDTSTNGVTVNDETLGFGLPRALADGDLLKLGDAVVSVRIESGPATSVPTTVAAVAPPISGPIIGDGPFGDAGNGRAHSDPPSPAEPGPQTAQEPGGVILDDWWKVDPPPGQIAEAIPVDISFSRGDDAIPDTTMAKDSLPSGSGDVAFLVESLADIDVVTLARAVDAAGLVLSEDERRRFHDRLHVLLAPDEGLRG